MSSNENSMARTGSNYSTKSGVRHSNLARLATENSAAAIMNKPKLIRQAAILADGDSTGSGKSVTFQVKFSSKKYKFLKINNFLPPAKKLLLLCNFPYVVIYLVNWRQLALKWKLFLTGG